jgi:hypothetical protein
MIRYWSVSIEQGLSALGQKQTFAPQKAMSALPPKATAKADFALLPCTVCGWRRADLRPDYSKQQAAKQSVGWMMPP